MSKIRPLSTLLLAGGVAVCVSGDTAQDQMSPDGELCSLTNESVDQTEADTAIDSTIDNVKTKLDWANEGGYLAFASDGEYVAAVKDLSLNIDVTREIRAIDPSLATGELNVLDYDAGADELLVGDGTNLWTVSGLFDYVLEQPNAKVSGEKVEVK